MLIFVILYLLIGAIAVYRFGALAGEKGYQPSKARRYPIILMIAALSAAIVLFLLTSLIGASMPQFQKIVQAVFLVGNWFVVAVNVLILRQAYRNMKKAPDAGGRSGSED